MIGVEGVNREILHIHIWAPGGFECTECGAEDLADDEVTAERFVLDDGTAVRRFVCPACARKIGLAGEEA